jgi:hypothetical protein
MMRAIDQNLWVAEHPFNYLGLSVGIRMTILRLNPQDLLVISPIPLDEDLQLALKQLGTVAHIVAPHCFHYQFAAACKALYPEATLWAAPGLPPKRPELPIDQVLIPGEQPWDELQWLFFKGFTNG